MATFSKHYYHHNCFGIFSLRPLCAPNKIFHSNDANTMGVCENEMMEKIGEIFFQSVCWWRRTHTDRTMNGNSDGKKKWKLWMSGISKIFGWYLSAIFGQCSGINLRSTKRQKSAAQGATILGLGLFHQLMWAATSGASIFSAWVSIIYSS